MTFSFADNIAVLTIDIRRDFVTPGVFDIFDTGTGIFHRFQPGIKSLPSSHRKSICSSSSTPAGSFVILFFHLELSDKVATH